MSKKSYEFFNSYKLADNQLIMRRGEFRGYYPQNTENLTVSIETVEFEDDLPVYIYEFDGDSISISDEINKEPRTQEREKQFIKELNKKLFNMTEKWH